MRWNPNRIESQELAVHAVLLHTGNFSGDEHDPGRHFLGKAKPSLMRVGDALRDHLVRVLDWEEAHVGFDQAVDGIPLDQRGAVAAGFEHSPWQLLEHMRIAQQDILDFCVNANYEHNMKWPDDYWPKEPEPPNTRAWSDSVASYIRSREDLKRLAREVEDLTATVPAGKGAQTYLRALLLVADHNAYHLGQLVAVRRALGVWK